MVTALLDADIIAFKVASVSQQAIRFDPEDEPYIQADDWDSVVPRIDRAVLDIQEALGTDKVIVCLSCPTAENWRLEVLPTYKGHRDYSKRPAHLAAVKDYMEAKWPSYRRPTLEADDIMGILSTMAGLPSSLLKAHPQFTPGDRKIIVSEDKDMKTIPGWLFNPAKDQRPSLISAAVADWWHLHQTICGDTTDGYAGCPGAGPEAAAQHRAGLSWVSHQHTFSRGPRKGTEETRWTTWDASEFETPWERLVSLYRRHGFTEADALVQARVARICRASDYDFKNRKVILWTPDSRP